MSFDENLKMGKYPVPYIYLIKKPGQNFFYFGTRHVFVNTQDFQLDILKHYFLEFLDLTRKRDCLVIVEGLKRYVASNAKEEGERARGEMQFGAYLAEKAGIEHICVEPPVSYEQDILFKDFSKDEIMTYYFIRSMHNWIRRGKNITFDEYMKRILERYQTESKWQDYVFSVESILSAYKNIVGKDFNENDKNTLEYLENPYHEDNQISRVSRRSGEIRDEYIVAEIIRIWNEGKNIFAVYGMNHAIAQEPALREMLK